jgi:HEAT repeat protein
MMQVARELLRHAQHDNNEYKLQVLVRSLFYRKHPQTLDLVISALESPDVSDKDIYVALLDELEGPRAEAALVAFVAAAPHTDDGNIQADVLVKAIDVLRRSGVEQAAPILLGKLNDGDERVRAAVIEFVTEMGVKSAVESFVLRLEREDDPDNLKALVNALVEWECIDALPYLRRTLEGTLSSDSESVREAIEDAITALTAKVADHPTV